MNTLIIGGFLLLSTVSCTQFEGAIDPSAMVYIKETPRGFELIRNGKPFRIKGAAGKGNLKELKRAGGNTLRLYDTIDLEQNLAEAQALGLAVIVDIPLPKFGDGSHFYAGDLTDEKEKISALVSRFSEHPALLYWNVGNELYYPTFYKPVDFFDQFNSLVQVVKEADPNHPVSTAVIGGNRRRIASVALKSPDLDLISINSFGNLTTLKEKMEPISMIWDGPFVISEWGVNGPWEEKETIWGAPIEPSSMAKARILKQRFTAPILKDEACLGSIVFYWGNKQERTETWFSIFTEDDYTSETYHALKNLWSNEEILYKGPQVKKALLNGKGAPADIILPPGTRTDAKVFMKGPIGDSIRIEWEIRKEAWSDIEQDQPVLQQHISSGQQTTFSFRTPGAEGPYRIFITAKDQDEHSSTANIPFYILNPAHEE